MPVFVSAQPSRTLAAARVAPSLAQLTARAPSSSVVIYGTSWCEHCREAKEFYQASGVSVTYHDVEADPSKEAEVKAKLRAAGLKFSGFPVIESGGKISVGFVRPDAAPKKLAQAEESPTDDAQESEPRREDFAIPKSALALAAGVLAGWFISALRRRS